MVKRKQSKSLDTMNKKYRDFLKAFLNDDEEGIENGYKQGFEISNKTFAEQLSKEITNVLNRNMIRPIRFKSYRLLNPQNINIIENGYTLLDVVSKMFSDAIDLEEEEGKDYFLNSYLFFVDKLIKMGAVLNNQPFYPTSIPLNAKLKNIIDMLESVNPYEE